MTFAYDESQSARFESHAEHSTYNAHYDRPAVLGLLGDVTGLEVLDAGCGVGFYAAELLARGAASVDGFDASESMIERARRRVPAATFTVAALGEPLPYAEEAFDAVVCALVIHHVDDRPAAYREIRRVLRPEARFVLSTVHPVGDWLRLGGSYFLDTGVVEEEWSSFGRVRFHRQTLTQVVDELADAGFVIERLLEPQPQPSARDVNEDDYLALQQQPGFLALRLRKA